MVRDVLEMPCDLSGKSRTGSVVEKSVASNASSDGPTARVVRPIRRANRGSATQQ